MRGLRPALAPAQDRQGCQGCQGAENGIYMGDTHLAQTLGALCCRGMSWINLDSLTGAVLVQH